MRIAIILLATIIQGCSSVYKTDYFSAESEVSYQERNPCLFSSGVGEKNYGEPQKAAVLNDDANIIICTRTRENHETITIGPLIFPIIPILSEDNSDDNIFIVTLWFKTEDKKLTINPNQIYLRGSNNKQMHMFNHTHGVASKCTNQIGYTDVSKPIELTGRSSVDFCFRRDNTQKSEYVFNVGGMIVGDNKLPAKMVVFKRYRSTFFAFAG